MITEPAEQPVSGELTSDEQQQVAEALRAVEAAAVAHAAIRARVASRMLREPFPTARSIDLETNVWTAGKEGHSTPLEIIAVHAGDGGVLWTHHNAWTEQIYTPGWDTTVRQAICEQLHAALRFATPGMSGWSREMGRAETVCADQDCPTSNSDVYRVPISVDQDEDGRQGGADIAAPVTPEKEPVSDADCDGSITQLVHGMNPQRGKVYKTVHRAVPALPEVHCPSTANDLPIGTVLTTLDTPSFGGPLGTKHTPAEYARDVNLIVAALMELEVEPRRVCSRCIPHLAKLLHRLAWAVAHDEPDREGYEIRTVLTPDQQAVIAYAVASRDERDNATPLSDPGMKDREVTLGHEVVGMLAGALAVSNHDDKDNGVNHEGLHGNWGLLKAEFPFGLYRMWLSRHPGATDDDILAAITISIPDDDDKHVGTASSECDVTFNTTLDELRQLYPRVLFDAWALAGDPQVGRYYNPDFGT